MNERSMDERSTELFGRVVAGELEPSSPEVREQAERDPALREALTGVDELRSALAQAGEEQADVMREALDEVTDADRAQVRERLNAHGGRPGTGTAGARSWGWLVALAAVVLALVWIAPWRDPGGGTGPLDGVEDGRAFPVGAVEAVDHFRLPQAMGPGDTARVSVYDSTAGPDATASLVSSSLTSDRWDLTEDQIAALPRRMRWTIELWDGTGERVSFKTYQAELVE